MSTMCASGRSQRDSTVPAVTEAVDEAMGKLGAAKMKPRVGFLFASSRHALEGALITAREMTGGADILGCTTAGEITERGITRNGISLMLMAGEELLLDTAVAGGMKSSHERAAATLCERFAETVAAARNAGRVASTTVALVDGLAGTGEKLIATIMKNTRSFQQVVGGAAGDDGRFEATLVGHAGPLGVRCGRDTAVALHLFGRYPVGVGVEHGLVPSTERMVVTRARGNVVYELDNKPAFEVYRTYARSRGVDLSPQSAGQFLMNNELGVYFLNRLQRARAPLSVGVDGSLTCAADIAEGASVTILDGKRPALVAAARAAAEEARGNLQGQRAAGVLLFDCVCRGAILGPDFSQEIDAVRSVFPGVPIAGLLTYGEIARYSGQLDGWHNTTAVVAAIPA